jgi:hypothetical protein
MMPMRIVKVQNTDSEMVKHPFRYYVEILTPKFGGISTYWKRLDWNYTMERAEETVQRHIDTLRAREALKTAVPIEPEIVKTYI